MKKTILAALLFLLGSVIPACADTLDSYDVSGVMSVSQGSATETVHFSFVITYDLSQEADATVSDTWSISTGPLTGFEATGGVPIHYIPFVDGIGDEFDLLIANPLSIVGQPSPPVFNGGSQLYECQSVACRENFSPGTPVPIDLYGTAETIVTPVSTPEPKSFALLAIGLLGLALLKLKAA